MAWIIPPIAGFIDTGIAPEFYIDGIGGIEIVNGNIRTYLISEQMPLEPAHDPHRLVACKIVGPLLNVPMIIGQLAQCLWQPARATAMERGHAPRLVP